MCLADRIKSERERLALTQPRVADLTGVGKTTVINWEKGVSSPTAVQLAALAAAGADVLFVVTGQRSQAAAEVELLPSDERVLVDAYRRCNAEARRNLIQTAALLSAGMGAPVSQPAAPGGGVRQTSHSNNAVQVHGSKNKISTKRS